MIPVLNRLDQCPDDSLIIDSSTVDNANTIMRVFVCGASNVPQTGARASDIET